MDLINRYNEQLKGQTLRIIDKIGVYVVTDVANALGNEATKDLVINAVGDKGVLIKLRQQVSEPVLRSRLQLYIDSDDRYLGMLTARPLAVLKNM